MKKFCYLLSIAGHALVWIIVVNARFAVIIRPEPARVVVVRITEPPLPFRTNGVPANAPPGDGYPATADGNAVPGAATGMSRGGGAGSSSSRGALTFAATGDFSLRYPSSGSFRLAPVGRTPDPWAIPMNPEAPPRLLRYRATASRPPADQGGDGGPGGVFLLPFDIREKAVAEWTDAVLARIERNWIIPASGRLAFSGRVQISLTIERQGRQRTLVIDDSNVPEPLTVAALHAVEASLPLPPLPEKVAGESFALTFVFAYNG